jgi:hypothetical protein
MSAEWTPPTYEQHPDADRCNFVPFSLRPKKKRKRICTGEYTRDCPASLGQVCLRVHRELTPEADVIVAQAARFDPANFECTCPTLMANMARDEVRFNAAKYPGKVVRKWASPPSEACWRCQLFRVVPYWNGCLEGTQLRRD